jgi:hypothetical protein
MEALFTALFNPISYRGVGQDESGSGRFID